MEIGGESDSSVVVSSSRGRLAVAVPVTSWSRRSRSPTWCCRRWWPACWRSSRCPAVIAARGRRQREENEVKINRSLRRSSARHTITTSACNTARTAARSGHSRARSGWPLHMRAIRVARPIRALTSSRNRNRAGVDPRADLGGARPDVSAAARRRRHGVPLRANLDVRVVDLVPQVARLAIARAR